MGIWPLKEGLAAAITPTFVNNYTNVSGVGYYKDPNGFVHLQGLVGNSGTPANYSTMFTLPAGYRPSADLLFVGITNASPLGVVGIKITTAGVVSFDEGTWDTHIGLNHCYFRAA